MKKTRIFALLLAAVVLAVSSGCSRAKVEEVDASLVSKYSDEMAENILMAINEESYEKYSMDFDETMKKTIKEEDFKKSNSIIKDRIGDYISKELLKAEKVTDKNGEYIVAYYAAKFSNEPEDVSIRVVFSEADGKRYVTGLWFDSPNLRKK